VITVIGTGDDPGVLTQTGAGTFTDTTLRGAINAANTQSQSTIAFDIPTGDSGYNNGTHTWTIQTGSSTGLGLPTITSPVTIDATTQPGYAGAPVIVLDGTNAGSGTNGLDLAATAGGSAVKGLVIEHFNGNGIEVDGGGNNVLSGNYIGVDATDSGVAGNAGDGILINGSSGNTIGGTAAGAGNVISGNGGDGVGITGSGATGNVLAGNYVGTDFTGTHALGAPNAYGFNPPGQVAVNIPQLNTNLGAATTVSFWMDWNGLIPMTPISFSNGNALYFNLNNSGFDHFGFAGGTNVWGIRTEGLVNQWHFVTALSVNGSVTQDQLWIDGVEQALTPALPSNYPTGSFSVTTSATIGPFAGALDDVAFFNQQLTPAQIQTEYAASLTGTVSATILGQGPVAYYPLDETSGSVAYDASGNGNNGTLSSGGIFQGVLGGPTGNHGNGVAITGGASGNTVGGAGSARNVIGGNGSNGVKISGSGTSSNVVENDFIGVDATGATALPNTNDGVLVANGATGNIIGDVTGATRNVLSGNRGNGVEISGAGTSDNQVAGDIIGLDVSGSTAVGGDGQPLGDRDAGVQVDGGATNNTIGGLTSTPGTAAGNVISGINSAFGPFGRGDTIPGLPGIAGFQGWGVAIVGPGTTGTVVDGNIIGLDATGTKGVGNNGGVLLEVTTNNTIGGVVAGARNIISNGIQLSVASSNLIAGNYIGTDITGTLARGTSAGILLSGGPDDYNTIGGTTASARNVISGNGIGIWVLPLSDTGNVMEGNYVGTDATGNKALPNKSYGMQIYGVGNTIGGTAPGAGNLVSGNTGYGYAGVHVAGTSDLVQGNTIGLAANGSPLPNYIGVLVTSANNTVGGTATGAGNVIAYNSFDGVGVQNAPGVTIRGNSIYANNALGIDLGTTGTPVANDSLGHSGPNLFQDYPVLQSAMVNASGDLMVRYSVPAADTSSTYPLAVDFYLADSTGQGETYLGSDKYSATDLANGIKPVDLGNAGALGAAVGNSLVATATDAPGNTSEFSPLGSSAVIVSRPSTATTVSSSAPSSVYGQSVTFTAVVSSSASGTPTGTVTFTDGSTVLGTGTLAVANSVDQATFTTSALSVASHSITASYGGDANFTGSASAALTQTVNAAPTTTSGSVSGAGYFGQAVTFTATVTANAPSTAIPNGSVDFYDTTTQTDLGSATLSTAGTATLTTTAPLPAGSQTFALSYLGNSNFLPSSTTVTVSIADSIYVLNSSASGALSVSGNSSINVGGAVVVDSKSPTALQANGNASVTASAIEVAGGVQVTGNATLRPSPLTGAAAVFDPEAGLAVPTVTNNQGSVNLSGSQALTINPGVYSSIKVSGSAKLTMSPGVYVIAGGGFTVTGNASVNGNGVMIYNAGSNYTTTGSGGNFGGITLSGNGTISLTAPATGAYAGVLIFQERDNNRAIAVGGNGVTGLSGGLIYAPQALLAVSGNAQLQHAPLIVGQLQLSGNGTSTLTNGSDSTNNTAGQLLAGDLSIYVDNSNGYFTADELTAIQDAITNTNTLLAPYGVSVAEVSDPTLANLTLDSNSTSACGGMAQGVLGCFNLNTSEITLIQGWNWYAGTDPNGIGAGQYSFETTVTHELGHALGLGGSSDPNSPMYESLPTGVAKGSLTVADLNLPPLDTTNADALHAAGFGEDNTISIAAATSTPVVPTVGAVVEHIGDTSGRIGAAAVLPQADGTLPALGAAELVTALADAPVLGDLAIPSPGVSTGPLSSGLVSSWNFGAAGVGALDSARPSLTSTNTSGGAPADRDFSDIRSLQWDDTEEDRTPRIPEPSALPEGEAVPGRRSEDGLQMPSLLAAAGIAAHPVTVDALLEHFAEVWPLDTGACATGLEEGAGKAYLLLPLVAGLAAHQGAHKGNTPRPLPESRGRRPRGW
jgi:hypothetical protein